MNCLVPLIVIGVVLAYLAVRQTYKWTGELAQKGAEWAVIKVTVLFLGFVLFIITLGRTRQ